MLPVLPVACHFHHLPHAGRSRLLAVWRLWRGLECRAARDCEERGVEMALNVSALAHDLQELIAALDRRLPGVAEAGEVAIARDAAALRAKAVERLAQLVDSAMVGTAR